MTIVMILSDKMMITYIIQNYLMTLIMSKYISRYIKIHVGTGVLT